MGWITVIVDDFNLIPLRRRAKLEGDVIVRLNASALTCHVCTFIKADGFKEVIYATPRASIVVGLGYPF
jgi:hypothetical protein